MHKTTDKLPIDNFRDKIEAAIQRNPITILTAETGAGKSTRVPLWLWKKGKRVHVTQPRRIAARTLALYLARLTGETLGKEVGYQTGFDSQQSKITTLLYLTDGVQMVREIKGRLNYDILILDEVHEWNLNQEVLIGLVKEKLVQGFYKRTGKRVVIMSATLQAERLSSFFNKAPVIEVPGRGFPVTMHHNNPHFLLPDAAQMVELERNVLVFQPGKQEIETFSDDLKRMLKAEKLKAKILPLHAELPLKEQAKVFDHYDLPKVIVATDIAQTSLTIDDIDAVVDEGIKKEVRVVRGIEGLYPVDISAAECMQRAGRAGRVRPGQYFLCADASIKDRSPFPDPEIQRLNLESVALRLIKMGISPTDFRFFHPPSKALLYKAIKRLKLLGAITEEGKITGDGNKMAELPVSLRSARLLLEAQKGNPQVVDSALKCIAILETKGIANRDYTGDKFSNIPYHSDLLNQLLLWRSFKIYRNLISHKKFSMAQEIYRTLKKRIQLPPVKERFSSQDMDVLFRAILSAFADQVHVKGGNEYQLEGDIRQLDRTSVLFRTKPEMVVGLPFDLVVNRENRDTGESEQYLIPLLTFSSEISLDYLETLAPFSYYRSERIFVDKSRLRVHREYYFGGRMIREVISSPNAKDTREMEQVARKALEWYRLEENIVKFKCTEKLEKTEADFDEIKTMVKGKLKPFAVYREDFFMRELREQLDIEDLNLFFKFHPGFSIINLKKLLPYRIIKELKHTQWPRFHEIQGESREIEYIGHNPFVRLDFPVFGKVLKEELMLPTGQWAGVIMGERKYTLWDLAVYAYNQWRKTTIFEKKFKGQRKPGYMEVLLDVPFPQPIESGKGKDNTPFQFYVVPEIEGKDVFLVHYFEEDNARKYFESIRPKWEEFCRQYKKSKIEDIFKQKGWKVK
ncbi:MAG: ATP-dependent RNA helicase [bacterium]|nr:ATP-dependent RNA helicase [bacterium]